METEEVWLKLKGDEIFGHLSCYSNVSNVGTYFQFQQEDVLSEDLGA